jgi:gas vesicle protein
MITMTENSHSEGDLIEEFRRLGENLKEAMQSAWDSEERKNLSKEIQSGLNAFGEAVGQAVDEMVESSTGQRMRDEIEDLTERVRSGELADETRDELLGLLRKANVNLEKKVQQWKSTEEETHPAGDE